MAFNAPDETVSALAAARFAADPLSAPAIDEQEQSNSTKQDSEDHFKGFEHVAAFYQPPGIGAILGI